jgi:hypothetical protein
MLSISAVMGYLLLNLNMNKPVTALQYIIEETKENMKLPSLITGRSIYYIVPVCTPKHSTYSFIHKQIVIKLKL